MPLRSGRPVILAQNDRAWRLRVTFAGKLPPGEYWSPDVRRANPGWGDEFMNRQVERLAFYLPTRPLNCIVLTGMEAYNFFVEASESFSRRGGARIEAFWVLGKLPGEPVVDTWRVGNGTVLHDRAPWGREWGGTATRGWKLGLVGAAVLSGLVEA